MVQTLNLENNYGEQTQNFVQGEYLPMPGGPDVVQFNGATTPVNGGSGTGVGVAGKGSTYTALDTGATYQNTGTKASPVWTAAGTGNTTTLLTGLSVANGVLAATDTILQGFNKLGALQNGSFEPTSETVAAAGALSTTKMTSLVNNASGSGIAVTLAAPSSQDGQLKVIKLGTATHNATLACTNIVFSGAYTPTGTTTLTFTNTGDCAVLMAVGAKWVYLGGSAIAS